MLRIFLFASAVMFLVSSCTKNGEPIVQQSYTALGIRALTVDALLLKVEVDDSALIAPTVSPFYSSAGNVKYVKPEHRVRMTDLYTNRLMLDTVVPYNTGTQTILNFVQTGADASIVWVGPPVNEPAPASGKTKISFVYVYDNLPDEVKVVVENSRSGSSELDYLPTDSFLLRRGQFSPYFPGWAGNISKKPKVKLYTSDAARTLLTSLAATAFGTAVAGISIYSLDPLGNSLTKLY